MKKIIQKSFSALLLSMAWLSANGAECASREVGGLTFTSCPEQVQGHSLVGRFEASAIAQEGKSTHTRSVLAGHEETLAFGEINPIPAALLPVPVADKMQEKKTEVSVNKPSVKVKRTKKKSPVHKTRTP
jgi:hypothetical protein